MIRAAILFCMLCFFSEADVIKGLKLKDLKVFPESVIYQKGSHKVNISPKIRLTVEIECSQKGNGLLKIFRDQKLVLTTKIVDQHDDGAVYKNGILNYFFIDLNGDGLSELVIKGTEIISNDENIKTGENSIHKVFKFDLKKNKWIPVNIKFSDL